MKDEGWVNISDLYFSGNFLGDTSPGQRDRVLKIKTIKINILFSNLPPLPFFIPPPSLLSTLGRVRLFRILGQHLLSLYLNSRCTL